MPEYLSVKDFADRAKVTPSAVYQRLAGDLKPYLTVLDGRKMLESKALKLYEEPVKALSEELEDLEEITHLSRLYDPKAYIEDLKVRISTLEAELYTEREHSREQSSKVYDLAVRFSELGRMDKIFLTAREMAVKEPKRNFLSRFFDWLFRRTKHV